MKTRTIIIKNCDGRKAVNIRGYIEMRLRKLIDKLSCQYVGEGCSMVVFSVRTSDTRFEELKHELDALYPETCVYLEPKKAEP